MAKIVSKEIKKECLEFIRTHFNIISQREMARRLGVGKTSINRWSEELGLKFKKHTVNEEFFDDWNQDSAYILGYIFSDGNVSWNPKKSYYSMTITASAKDVDHLQNIRSKLTSTKPLLYAPSTKSYRLIVNSKKLCRRLMSLGVIPRKSLIVKFPNIPKELISHFIRGVIDGDGSLYFLDRKRSPYFSVKVYSGSEDFMIGLAKAIKNNFGILGNIRKVNKSTFGIDYSCSRGKDLAKVLYTDASLFLERKYKVYKYNVLEA